MQYAKHIKYIKEFRNTYRKKSLEYKIAIICTIVRSEIYAIATWVFRPVLLRYKHTILTEFRKSVQRVENLASNGF